MITNTKNPTHLDDVKLETVYFLVQDGSQVNEVPILNDNRVYVSATDHNKFGKVEVYKIGNSIKEDYFLKQYRGGRPGELLVDPYGMFSKQEDLSAFVTQRGHKFCEYIPVKADVYNSYVNYLLTRDSRYFRFAEKAILDTVR